MKRFLQVLVRVLGIGMLALIVLYPVGRFVMPPGIIGSRVHDEPPMPGRPECPRHSTVFIDSSGTWVPRPVEIAGSGLITAVPEYHDCQRFKLADRGPRYGPLVAIFARIKLFDLADPPGFIPPTPQQGASYYLVPSGVNARLTTVANIGVTVNPRLAQPAPPPPPSGDITAKKDGRSESVATILNYDEPYEPLRLPHGFSCLYVHHNGSTWAAELVQVAADTDCLRPLADWPTRVPLNIRAIYDPNPPPVARWDWDEVSSEQFIGIACGSSWCEVWNPSRTTLNSSPPRGMGKGWYDEQYLAEKATNSGHPDNLTPGPALGDVTPIGDLTSYEAGDGAVFAGTWIPVADVALSKPSPAYAGKFKYLGGGSSTNPVGKTTVSLCKGTARECHLSTIEAILVNNCDNAKDPWYARVESPLGTKYRCVIRRKPDDPATPLAPGIVRWRWKLKDEGMWIRCPGGCCEKT